MKFKFMRILFLLMFVLVFAPVLSAEVDDNLRVHRISNYWVYDEEFMPGGIIQFNYDADGQLDSMVLLENTDDLDGAIEVLYDEDGHISEMNAFEIYNEEEVFMGAIELTYQNDNPVRIGFSDTYDFGLHFTIKMDTTLQSQLYHDILSLFGLTGQLNGVITTLSYQEGDPSDPEYFFHLQFEYDKNGVLESITIPEDVMSTVVKMIYDDLGNLLELRGESLDGEYYGSIGLDYEEDRIVRINFVEADGSINEYMDVEYLEIE